jgi:hypothetical protein
MLNAIKRLTGYPWFKRINPVVHYAAFLQWQFDPWFQTSRLQEIDAQVRDLKTAIETAKKTKRARRHLYAKLHDLTTARLRIERGL